MFVIAALISSANDLIYITGRLIYQHEHDGTLGGSSAFSGLICSEQSPTALRQSEECSSVSKAKYSGRYMMRDRGRQRHTESGGWREDGPQRVE